MAKPAILPGWAGAFAVVTVNVRAVDAPQVLFAVTEIVPPVAPVVALIEAVVEVPL